MYIYYHFPKNLSVAVADEPFIPRNEVDNSIEHPEDWTDDETKKASYDLKIMSILIFALSVKVLYTISHHKSIKAMWDALQTLYEGTKDIEDSKINMVIYEFKVFLMELGEFVESIQTRFLHLIRKLNNLGKSTSNKYCANKILRSMCREWKLKVTTIKDSNYLNTLDIIKLFGKLIGHVNELKRLADSEVEKEREM